MNPATPWKGGHSPIHTGFGALRLGSLPVFLIDRRRKRLCLHICLRATIIGPMVSSLAAGAQSRAVKIVI